MTLIVLAPDNIGHSSVATYLVRARPSPVLLRAPSVPFIHGMSYEVRWALRVRHRYSLRQNINTDVNIIRFEICTPVKIYVLVLCVVTPCSLGDWYEC